MREWAIWQRTLGLLVFRDGWLSREGFYKTLSNLGVLPGLEISLQSSVKVPVNIKYHCVFISVPGPDTPDPHSTSFWASRIRIVLSSFYHQTKI
jgi:hypothetical protein